MTFESSSAISKLSSLSIFMIKASVTCSSSFSLISSLSSIFLFKSYMIMNDLFAMFADKKKRFRKSLNIIYKQMRFSRFSMLIRRKSLTISNLSINYSIRSNSMLLSIHFVRHFEFVFQSIE